MEKSEIRNNIKEYLTTLYEKNLEEIDKYSSAFINGTRRKAIESFKETGFTHFKGEKYLYTDIESTFNPNLKSYFNPASANIDLTEIFRCGVPEMDTSVFITVNGWYNSKEEKLKVYDNGFIIGSISEASKKYPELFNKHYNKYADNETDGVISINTALAQDGLFMYIPKGLANEKPFQIINLVISEEELMVNQRNLIIAEDNSQVKVIICDHSLTQHKFLFNDVTEIVTGQNSNVEYYKVQNSHNHATQISSTYVYQKSKSNFLSNVISLHGGLIRNNINILMDEEGCESFVGGLYLTDKKQHLDNFVSVEHAKPNCSSRQVFRGVLDDNATAVFNGKILVQKDAQHTNAYQTNNNILLSDDAKINTKPQLEIYADDVKCSHGATVGQLDENALFYLRSRGIDIKEAKLLLMYAFAHEIIKNLKIDHLKERIEDLVDKRLRGEFSRCNCCSFKCGRG